MIHLSYPLEYRLPNSLFGTRSNKGPPTPSSVRDQVFDHREQGVLKGVNSGQSGGDAGNLEEVDSSLLHTAIITMKVREWHIYFFV